MTGRTSRLELLLRALTAFALLGAGVAVLSPAAGGPGASLVATHVELSLATAAGASALDVDGPVGAWPGASTELADRRAERNLARVDSPRASQVRAPCRWLLPAGRLAAAGRSEGGAPESREPTMACGFVSSRPTAPPVLRS